MADRAKDSEFLYVTYIRTTPQALWSALTDPATIRAFWFGMTVECDFAAGSPWRLKFEDGRVADEGEVLEADPPRRLALRWRNAWNPEFASEGDTRCTFELEAVDSAVKLTVHHCSDQPDSRLITAVSGGWPKILCNLKTLLETDSALFAG